MEWTVYESVLAAELEHWKIIKESTSDDRVSEND